jgi:hypothetical protein
VEVAPARHRWQRHFRQRKQHKQRLRAQKETMAKAKCGPVASQCCGVSLAGTSVKDRELDTERKAGQIVHTHPGLVWVCGVSSEPSTGKEADVTT